MTYDLLTGNDYSLFDLSNSRETTSLTNVITYPMKYNTPCHTACEEFFGVQKEYWFNYSPPLEQSMVVKDKCMPIVNFSQRVGMGNGPLN